VEVEVEVEVAHINLPILEVEVMIHTKLMIWMGAAMIHAKLTTRMMGKITEARTRRSICEERKSYCY
jgi:hypothetical protein